MIFREVIKQYPFIRILLPITIGIGIAQTWHINSSFIVLILLICFGVITLLVTIPKLRKSHSISFIFGLTLTLFFIHIGLLRVHQVDKKMLLSVPDSCELYRVRLDDYPIPKAKTDLLSVTILEAYKNQNVYPQTAKAILYIPKEKQNSQLQPNNCLWIKTNLKRVRNQGNPNEFDYAAYLKTKHILYTAYLQKENYYLAPNNQFSLREQALVWRKQLLNIYRSRGISGASFDILSALTLGNKKNIDPTIKQAWINAGAIHVLAVSGLHVAIIYLIANFFLRYLLRWRYGRGIRAILLLCVLWLYAFITGLSPSIMRAATMFSFVIVGKSLDRETSVYNSLAASATLLLIIDPYLLFSVGFQFSYISVFGIVLIQPHLKQLLIVSNNILFYFWQLTTVALAAQIAIFPLTIYYFHQFPTYFLLSSYVVIITAGVLIYLSAFLLCIHQVDFIADILGRILHFSTKCIHSIIVDIQELPHAVQTNCYFSTYEMIVVYLIIISMLFLFIAKQKRALFVLFIGIILLRIPVLLERLMPAQAEMVVFNVRNNSLLAFKEGQNVLFLCNKSIDKATFERVTTPYLLTKRIKQSNTKYLHQVDVVKWHKQYFFIIGEMVPAIASIVKRYPTNGIVLRKKGLHNARELEQIKAKMILDNSIFYPYRFNAPKLLKNSFNIKINGAFCCQISDKKIP